ncbi:MAG TPA: response regulator [Verrucomicrobia bacterium]|nr:response regulator [Verrucomicrobiota bacterium]HOP97897.1 ATP-binding protein [Verrucomicrobiota bacterium]HPU57698.1 ATP-binding protein [Verrucomicrobiota bacterium]
MNREIRILMVEDKAADALLIHHALRKAGLRFRSRRVDSRDAFLHELEHHPPDVILSDHGVPGFDGFAALAEARSRCADVPFIFVTGAPREQIHEETLRSGADDYVLKDTLHLLAPAIDRSLRDADVRARHRKLDAALADAEEQLRLLTAEFEEYASFMLDGEGCVASWNPGAERLLGYEPGEILGQDARRFFPDLAAGQDAFGEALKAALREGRMEQTACAARRSGERFRARQTIVSLRRKDGKSGFLCIIRDLSQGERRPAGTGRDPAQLEAANRELEEFTHHIALELRAPLRHIESFCGILMRNAFGRLDPKSRSYLKTIADSSHQLGRLVDDLFNFSRIGRSEMYRLHVSLRDLVDEVIHDLRSEAEGREIEWRLGELPQVEGDPVMLWVVLTNLVSNALKFTRPRRHARIEISGRPGERETVVSVRDNGVGFDMARAERLFGPFQRLHTKEFEGAGLGLANVRRIIERHHGRVWAESEEGKGAAFYFSLPAGRGP